MRRRVLLLLLIAVCATCAQVAWARPLGELIDLAAKDAFPEVRAAAGLALGELLIDSSFSDGELETMAVEGASSELRAAAGVALEQRLLVAGLDLQQLEELARGPTPELRAAAIPALAQATVAAVGRGELSLAQLAASIAQGASHELRLARAQTIFLLLRAELVAPEAQAEVESILRGEIVEVKGVNLDGGVEEIRSAAGDLLAGIYKFYGFLNRLQDPLADLMAVVTDTSITPEFRAAAGEALEVVFLAEGGRAGGVLQKMDELLDGMREQAQEGKTEEARQSLQTFQELLADERETLTVTAEVTGEFTATQRLENVSRNLEKMKAALATGDLASLNGAISSVKRDLKVIQDAVSGAPDVSLEELQEWAISGGTVELRQAAGAALGKRLLQAGLSLEELIELTIRGESPELRAGASDALTVRLSALDLSEAALLKMISEYSWGWGARPGTSVEMGQALSRALAERFKTDAQAGG